VESSIKYVLSVITCEIDHSMKSLNEREIQPRNGHNQRDTEAPLGLHPTKEMIPPTIFEVHRTGKWPELKKHVEKVTTFLTRVKPDTKKIAFSLSTQEEGEYLPSNDRDGFLHNNRGGQDGLCIPRVIHQKMASRYRVIDQAHSYLVTLNL